MPSPEKADCMVQSANGLTQERGIMSQLVIGDEGYLEIVGEMTRGGQDMLGTYGGYEVLGDAVQSSPSFRNYAAAKAANARPMLHRTPLQKARDWQIDFGPVSGAAGTTTTITVQPQCLFRGEKIMATDTGSPAGTGTRI